MSAHDGFGPSGCQASRWCLGTPGLAFWFFGLYEDSTPMARPKVVPTSPDKEFEEMIKGSRYRMHAVQARDPTAQYRLQRPWSSTLSDVPTFTKGTRPAGWFLSHPLRSILKSIQGFQSVYHLLNLSTVAIPM